MSATPEPLPKQEFDWIFARVPRLTVEIVIARAGLGVLLSMREIEPCRGMWHLPGGTVRFGEPVTDAVERVAREELGLTVSADRLLGYIEYPSHYEHGLDSPVGLAFSASVRAGALPPPGCKWFEALPVNIHDEQRQFLAAHAADVLEDRLG